MLNWADAELAGDTVALEASSGNAAEWSLLLGGDATDFAAAAGYTLYLDGAAEGIALELNGAALAGTGTVFDGYQLYTEDNTLKFGRIAG